MDNYTLDEKKFLTNLCKQLSVQLKIQIEIDCFKKYISPMWRETTIELKSPLIIKNKILLYIQSIDNCLSFNLSFYNNGCEYKVHWYKYLRDKYNRDIELHMNSSNKYVEWFVSEIRSAIEEEIIIVSISSQGKESYDKEICLQEVLNECKVFTK